MAAETACARNSGSARVASAAENSTLGHSCAQADTSAVIRSSIFVGFSAQVYSICTADTGSSTTSRGCFAPCTACQA